MGSIEPNQPSSLSAPPSSSSGTICPICTALIPGTYSDVQSHVNKHLDNNNNTASSPSTSSSQNVHAHAHAPRPILDKPFDQLSPAEKMIHQLESDDAALAHSIQFQTPSQPHPLLTASLNDSAEISYPNVLNRLLPLFQPNDSITASLKPTSRRRFHLSSPLDFYTSNMAGLGWDCGYRNIQMMFSALFYDPLCRTALYRKGVKEVPTVLEIASGIEDAWRNGFDREGASTLDGKLVGKQVWIGALEAQALLKNCGINALLEDFETPTLADRQRMFEWVYSRFEQFCVGSTGSSAKYCAIHSKNLRNIPLIAPMFCQWHGHSVTIMGAMKSATGNVSLIILDPSRACYQSFMTKPLTVDLFRRDANHPEMKHPRFQLVYIPSVTIAGLSSSASTSTPSSQVANGDQSNNNISNTTNHNNHNSNGRNTSAANGNGNGNIISTKKLLRTFRLKKR